VIIILEPINDLHYYPNKQYNGHITLAVLLL